MLPTAPGVTHCLNVSKNKNLQSLPPQPSLSLVTPASYSGTPPPGHSYPNARDGPNSLTPIICQNNILGGPTISKVFSYEVCCNDRSPQLSTVGMGQVDGLWGGGLWLHFLYSRRTDSGLGGEYPTEQIPKFPWQLTPVNSQTLLQ